MDRMVGTVSPTQVLLRANAILYIVYILFVLTDWARADSRQRPPKRIFRTRGL